jgi:hypothetical protein
MRPSYNPLITAALLLLQAALELKMVLRQAARLTAICLLFFYGVFRRHYPYNRLHTSQSLSDESWSWR